MKNTTLNDHCKILVQEIAKLHNLENINIEIVHNGRKNKPFEIYNKKRGRGRLLGKNLEQAYANLSKVLPHKIISEHNLDKYQWED